MEPRLRRHVLYGDMDVCGVSPSIKVPLKTELHAGQPDASAPKTQAASQPGAPKQPLQNSPPAGTPTSGGKPPCTEPRPSRDAVGNPVARLREVFVDWAGRQGIPTLGLWRWDDFKTKSGPTKPLECSPANVANPSSAMPTASTATPPTVAPSSSPPRAEQPRTAALPSTTVKVAALDQAPPQEVTGLLNVMAEQIRWNWKKSPLTQNSAAILSEIGLKTLGEPESKDETQSNGACYKSVKIGLKRANYVSAINDDIPAKTAGAWLMQQGFANVTSSLPDARWAWPGDVIVYRYTDDVEAKNDDQRKAKLAEAIKKYDAAKQAYDKQREEFDQAKADFDKDKANWPKEHPGKPFTGKFTRKAPKAPEMPKVPDVNYGHIDVRSYESYLSDFHPGSNALPAATKFVVTGIYRKLSDPLPDIRLRAFLKVIREWECHEEADDSKRYFMLGMGLKIDGLRTFSDVSKHPFEGTTITKNNPAGAYQILLSTYQGYAAPRFGIGSGFSPTHQDRFAVALIESQKGNPLNLIRCGRIDEAAAALSSQWSSLPGGREPRTEKRAGANYIFTMKDLVDRHNSFMNELFPK